MLPPITNADISDRDILQASYMFFVTDGGLFISTNSHKAALGDVGLFNITFPKDVANEINYRKSLLNRDKDSELRLRANLDSLKVAVRGQVVWISPNGYKSRGFGIQIVDDKDNIVKNVIEKVLAGLETADQATFTM